MERGDIAQRNLETALSPYWKKRLFLEFSCPQIRLHGAKKDNNEVSLILYFTTYSPRNSINLNSCSQSQCCPDRPDTLHFWW